MLKFVFEQAAVNRQEIPTNKAVKNEIMRFFFINEPHNKYETKQLCTRHSYAYALYHVRKIE